MYHEAAESNFPSRGVDVNYSETNNLAEPWGFLILERSLIPTLAFKTVSLHVCVCYKTTWLRLCLMYLRRLVPAGLVLMAPVCHPTEITWTISLPNTRTFLNLALMNAVWFCNPV